jgi:hypothetical protein
MDENGGAEVAESVEEILQLSGCQLCLKCAMHLGEVPTKFHHVPVHLLLAEHGKGAGALVLGDGQQVEEAVEAQFQVQNQQLTVRQFLNKLYFLFKKGLAREEADNNDF